MREKIQCQIIPTEIVASKLGPVLPDYLLHPLFLGSHDGKPHQHRPQAVLLTDVVRTWSGERWRRDEMRCCNPLTLCMDWARGRREGNILHELVMSCHTFQWPEWLHDYYVKHNIAMMQKPYSLKLSMNCKKRKYGWPLQLDQYFLHLTRSTNHFCPRSKS